MNPSLLKDLLDWLEERSETIFQVWLGIGVILVGIIGFICMLIGWKELALSLIMLSGGTGLLGTIIGFFIYPMCRNIIDRIVG